MKKASKAQQAEVREQWGKYWASKAQAKYKRKVADELEQEIFQIQLKQGTLRLESSNLMRAGSTNFEREVRKVFGQDVKIVWCPDHNCVIYDERGKKLLNLEY